MKAFIFTLGTRGDVQPFVALASGLKDAGHEVTICTSNRFAPFIRDYGLDFSDFNDDFTEIFESKEGRNAMEGSKNPWTSITNMRRLMKKASRLQRSMMADGWRAARDFNPDVIIFHPKAYGGVHFAEKLGVPAAMALAMPGLIPTREFPAQGFPRLPLGRAYNRSTYRLILALTRRMFRKYVNEWRSQNGLEAEKPERDIFHDQAGNPVPVLNAYSSHVVPIPSDWPESSVVTGYWFLERRKEWEPPAGLAQFLQAGEPPVYVGFGSMSGENAETRTQLVVSALERARTRGILVGGWGGLSNFSSSNQALFLADVPHDWLFPKMALLVHHGGAGTTAAGLRAGRPAVICPFVADQPFWGECLNERGLGPPPIPQRTLTVEKLASAIREVLSSKQMQEQCRIVGEKISSEGGVKRAVTVVESLAFRRK